MPIAHDMWIIIIMDYLLRFDTSVHPTRPSLHSFTVGLPIVIIISVH